MGFEPPKVGAFFGGHENAGSWETLDQTTLKSVISEVGSDGSLKMHMCLLTDRLPLSGTLKGS